MAVVASWSELTFGKYKGKTLPQVVLCDPDWFFWAITLPRLQEWRGNEVRETAYKACHIKIPKPDPENWRIVYHFSADGKFNGFSIMTAEHARLEHLDSQISYYLDFSYPRDLQTYDKLGNKLMLRAFRKYYFGGSRLTKQKCESFFSNNQIFILPPEKMQTPNFERCTLA